MILLASVVVAGAVGTGPLAAPVLDVAPMAWPADVAPVWALAVALGIGLGSLRFVVRAIAGIVRR